MLAIGTIIIRTELLLKPYTCRTHTLPVSIIVTFCEIKKLIVYLTSSFEGTYESVNVLNSYYLFIYTHMI